MTFSDFFTQQAKAVQQLAKEWGEHPNTLELLAGVASADLTNERVATAAGGSLLTAFRAARHAQVKDGIAALVGIALRAAASDPYDLDF